MPNVKKKKEPRGRCRVCGVKKYRKFLTAVGVPRAGGWGHGGYWKCKNVQKCLHAKAAKTLREKHIENRGG